MGKARLTGNLLPLGPELSQNANKTEAPGKKSRQHWYYRSLHDISACFIPFENIRKQNLWAGREVDGSSNGKCRFPLMFEVLLRETSNNPAALLLLTTSQGTDSFDIAGVFSVSCKLSDIKRARVGSYKPSWCALWAKCTPAHPVLHPHYVSRSGLSRDLRRRTNPRWQNLPDTGFIRTGL